MREGKDRGKFRIVNSYRVEMVVKFWRDEVRALKRPRLGEDMSVYKKRDRF